MGCERFICGLRAERLLAAVKAERKIAVEIKSFVGMSEIVELEKAVGQYIVYEDVLSEVECERRLYLAVHEHIYQNLFEEPLGELLIP